MDLGKYSRKNLLTPREFSPLSPDGRTLETIKIKIQSVKSDDVIALYDELLKDTSPVASSFKEKIAEDIRIAKTLVVGIDGITIDGVAVENTPENIEMIVTDFDFIRNQVIANARDDMFFFGN